MYRNLSAWNLLIFIYTRKAHNSIEYLISIVQKRLPLY